MDGVALVPGVVACGEGDVEDVVWAATASESSRVKVRTNVRDISNSSAVINGQRKKQNGRMHRGIWNRELKAASETRFSMQVAAWIPPTQSRKQRIQS